VSKPRFFIDAELNPGLKLTLPQSVSHHLLTVLRLKPGDSIIAFNGRGGEFHGVLEATSKKSAIVNLMTYDDVSRAASIEVNLGLCVLKRDAMDRAIARSVELGIHSLTPLISEHCTVAHRIIENRHDHWHQVIVAACEQCGLNRLPALLPAVTLAGWLKSTNTDLKLIATQLGSGLPDVSRTGSVAVVTGPEGGFAEAELQLASQSGFHQLKLGSRILRGETAPIVALSAIHQTWGDFSG